jgi:hypothetical protein
MKNLFIKPFLLILLASWGFATPIKSQSWFTLTLGGGDQEQLNLGIRVKTASRLYIGAFAGLGGDWSMDLCGLSGNCEHKDSFASLGAAAFYHFAGSSPHTELPPWYLRAGPTYVYSNKEKYTQKSTWADIRAGRAFNFDPRIGFELDAGINILLNAETSLKRLAVPDDAPSKKIRQALGFRLFFRI